MLTLFLLLQISGPVLYPTTGKGLIQFNFYVREACSMAPPLMLDCPVVDLTFPTQDKATYTAWVYQSGRSAITATSDFLAFAPPPALKWVAYHETCHIRLGHHRMPFTPRESMHIETDACMQRYLGLPQFLDLQKKYVLYLQYVFFPHRRNLFPCLVDEVHPC